MMIGPGIPYTCEMPKEHLHAETNQVLVSHGLLRVTNFSAHGENRWEGNWLEVVKKRYSVLEDDMKSIGWIYTPTHSWWKHRHGHAIGRMYVTTAPPNHLLGTAGVMRANETIETVTTPKSIYFSYQWEYFA
jgi:hypothetical protein